MAKPATCGQKLDQSQDKSGSVYDRSQMILLKIIPFFFYLNFCFFDLFLALITSPLPSVEAINHSVYEVPVIADVPEMDLFLKFLKTDQFLP